MTGGASGTGSGTVTFQAAANTGAARSGSITVAGITFTVEEATGANLPRVGSLAHITTGGGWQSTMSLVNTGSAGEEVVVSFYDDNGNPLALPVNYPQAPLATPVLAYSIDRILLPGAEWLIQAAGTSSQPNVSGWALVQASGTLTGSGLFDWAIAGAQQEAVVQLENRTPNSFVLQFDQTNGYVLGIAAANTSATAAGIPAILRDDTGATIATGTITLPGMSAIPAMGHTSFMLSDKFAAAAGRRGTLELQVPAGGSISTVAFRANTQGSLATVLPLTK